MSLGRVRVEMDADGSERAARVLDGGNYGALASEALLFTPQLVLSIRQDDASDIAQGMRRKDGIPVEGFPVLS